MATSQPRYEKALRLDPAPGKRKRWLTLGLGRLRHHRLFTLRFSLAISISICLTHSLLGRFFLCFVWIVVHPLAIHENVGAQYFERDKLCHCKYGWSSCSYRYEFQLACLCFQDHSYWCFIHVWVKSCSEYFQFPVTPNNPLRLWNDRPVPTHPNEELDYHLHRESPAVAPLQFSIFLYPEKYPACFDAQRFLRM